MAAPRPDTLPAEVPSPGGSRLWWVAVLAVAAVVLELACRIEDRITWGMDLFTPVTGSADLVLRDAQGARGRPNTRFRGWQLDSLGFRGPDVPRVATAGTARVVTAGASETFGLYEAPGREYPRQLQDTLGAALPLPSCGAPTQAVEVINAALPGMALPSLQHHLRTVVAPLRPNVVVVYASPGFYLNVRAPEVARAVNGDTALPRRQALRPRAVERMVTQAKALAPRWVMRMTRDRATARTVARYPAWWHFTTVPPNRLARFDADLRGVVGTVRAIGAEPVLMGYTARTMEPGFDDPDLLSAWSYQFPRATGQVLAAFHDSAAARIARVAADSGATYVDLRPAFTGRWDAAFADFVHFTNAGASVVAGTLAPAVRTALGHCTTGRQP